jgi:hypothetical protein
VSPLEIVGAMATDAGMFGLWAPSSFRSVVDYETWEPLLLEEEDIKVHVAAGALSL